MPDHQAATLLKKMVPAKCLRASIRREASLYADSCLAFYFFVQYLNHAGILYNNKVQFLIQLVHETHQF